MPSKVSPKEAKTTTGGDEKTEFPDFPKLKPGEIASMSHEEKVKLIEKEAQTLYDFCVEKGLSKKDLSWCLKPLFGSPPELVKKAVKDNSKFFAACAFIGCLLAVIFGWATAYNLVCVHGKLALMKVLPYWDWTYLYDQDCVVKNPYMTPERNLTKDDCYACLDLTKSGIDGLKNVTQDVIANDFLLTDFPAVIEDGTRGWPSTNISLDSLSEDYSNNKDLDSIGECRFNSSIETIANVYEFFKLYESNSLPESYYAHWENCDLKAAKHFRLYYRRPYYLPPMAEAAKMNSFFIAKGKTDEPVTLIEDDSSGMWLTVIKGKLMADIVPVEACGNFKGCGMVSNELKKGEALVAPLRLWQVDVSATGTGETIAIGSTMTWDENEGLPEEEEEVDAGATKGAKKTPKSEPQGGADGDIPAVDEEDGTIDGPDGEGPEGDSPEGDLPEGDGPEGDGPEGDGPEGDGPEGDGPEVDGPEGDVQEGDSPGGDIQEGDDIGDGFPEGDAKS